MYKDNLINSPQAVHLGSLKTTVAVNKSRVLKGSGTNLNTLLVIKTKAH